MDVRALRLLVVSLFLLVQGLAPMRAAAMQASMLEQAAMQAPSETILASPRCHSQVKSQSPHSQRSAVPSCCTADGCHCPNGCGSTSGAAMQLALAIWRNETLEPEACAQRQPAAAHGLALLRPPSSSA